MKIAKTKVTFKSKFDGYHHFDHEGKGCMERTKFRENTTAIACDPSICNVGANIYAWLLKYGYRNVEITIRPIKRGERCK